jgi:hypothetical protein
VRVTSEINGLVLAVFWFVVISFAIGGVILALQVAMKACREVHRPERRKPPDSEQVPKR